jgi:hypothetical protein
MNVVVAIMGFETPPALSQGAVLTPMQYYLTFYVKGTVP